MTSTNSCSVHVDVSTVAVLCMLCCHALHMTQAANSSYHGIECCIDMQSVVRWLDFEILFCRFCAPNCRHSTDICMPAVLSDVFAVPSRLPFAAAAHHTLYVTSYICNFARYWVGLSTRS